MRLNIGCGNRRIEGYTGVDVVPRSGADIVAPADKIPLPDGCADEVMAIHLIEHVLPWRLQATLNEWARLLKPGGLLVIEAPDLIKCCTNIIKGYKGPKHPDQLGLWGIFGDSRLEDEHMLHHWAYTFDSLKPMVQVAGFHRAEEKVTQYHNVGRRIRDFRLEAYRQSRA